MASVGKPSPSTPLHDPGETEGKRDREQLMGGKGIEHGGSLRSRRPGHNVDDTSPAFVRGEGRLPWMGCPPVRFDLTDLRLFLNVAEAASITGGAERSGLALASASARIRGMEADFGDRVARARAPRRPARRQPDRLCGTMRSGWACSSNTCAATSPAMLEGCGGMCACLANTAAAAEFLPEPLADYLAANPEIDVELEERPSHEIVAAVAGGLADAGIVADTVDLGRARMPSVRARSAGGDRPPRSSRTGWPVETWHCVDVTEHELVGLGAGSALQAHLARHAATAGRRLKLRVRLGSLDAVCRMAGMGVGLAIVPERSARRSQRALGLRIAMLTDAWASRQLRSLHASAG